MGVISELGRRIEGQREGGEEREEGRKEGRSSPKPSPRVEADVVYLLLLRSPGLLFSITTVSSHSLGHLPEETNRLRFLRQAQLEHLHRFKAHPASFLLFLQSSKPSPVSPTSSSVYPTELKKQRRTLSFSTLISIPNLPSVQIIPSSLPLSLETRS